MMYCVSLTNGGAFLSMNSAMGPNRSLGLKCATDSQTEQ